MEGNDRTAAIAAAMLEFRRGRSDSLPKDLFSEPAWDLLLALFVADAEGQRLTAREVCQRSHIAPTVMSYWLIHLNKTDLVVGDGNGNLDDLLTLSGSALNMIEEMMMRARHLVDAISL